LDATGLTRPSVNPAAIEVQQKAAEAIAELITMLVRFLRVSRSLGGLIEQTSRAAVDLVTQDLWSR
jgi:hypothetical protein